MSKLQFLGDILEPFQVVLKGLLQRVGGVFSQLRSGQGRENRITYRLEQPIKNQDEACLWLGTGGTPEDGT